MRITEEEKRKAGLFRLTKQRRPSPVALATIGGLLLLTMVALALVVF
jgi:uncharacterized membrane protein (UPF0136 family)